MWYKDFGFIVKIKLFGYNSIRLEEFISFFIIKFINNGKIFQRKNITKNTMKNINKYIISDINRKNYGFGNDYYSISNFFQYDRIIKKGDISIISN